MTDKAKLRETAFILQDAYHYADVDGGMFAREGLSRSRLLREAVKKARKAGMPGPFPTRLADAEAFRDRILAYAADLGIDARTGYLLPSKEERDAAYKRDELQIAMTEERRVNLAPLADRKENAAEFAEVLQTDAGLAAERIDWLLSGHYGHGTWLRGWRTMDSSEGDLRRADLVKFIGIYEWRCPSDMTYRAWHKLTVAQKQALATAVNEVIDRQLKRRTEEGI